MKFILTLFMFALLSVSVQAQTIKAGDKVLVAYYSHSGNTREAAAQIQRATGGDLFEIEPLNAYPDEYRELTAYAKKEIADGVHPELKSKLENINDYNVVFIGSPCWWGTIASPVATFLADNDLSGKKLIPFMTHGGSGLGHSEQDIKKLVPDADLVSGKAFWGSQIKSTEPEVIQWVKELKND